MSGLTFGGGRPLRGRVRVPGDKSISHRALLFNGLAQGSARVEGLLDALDVRCTAACMRLLGAFIEDGRVVGVGGRVQEPPEVLDCGNSGTSMRLLTGLLAGQPVHAVLTGDVHLRRRPMDRVAEPLRQMGARIDGRQGGRLAPLAVRGGALRGLHWRSPVASAQVRTALTLAVLGGEGELRVSEPAPSRDHTERMLSAMGVRLWWEGDTLVVPGGQVPQAVDVVVPGDISSAAFFLVAATLCPGSDLTLENVGVNPTRAGVLEVLDAMGADIQRLNPREVSGEPVADLRVRHAGLRGVDIGGALIPRLIDEVPVLAVAAAFAEGETTVRDAAELRVKESDRAAATVAGLRALGGQAEELPDGLVVAGSPLRGGAVDSRGDHRIAMAFAVAAAALAQGEVFISDTDNIATSFPEFPRLMEQTRAAAPADHRP